MHGLAMNHIVVTQKSSLTAFSTEYILWEHNNCKWFITLPSCLHITQAATTSSHIPHHTKVLQGVVPEALFTLIPATFVNAFPNLLCNKMEEV